MPFKPGESGNPAGRKPGAKNKYTAFRKMVDPDVPGIIAKIVQMALDGDLTASKMLINRVWPENAEEISDLRSKMETIMQRLDEMGMKK